MVCAGKAEDRWVLAFRLMDECKVYGMEQVAETWFVFMKYPLFILKKRSGF
jgi:hypothetical protein